MSLAGVLIRPAIQADVEELRDLVQRAYRGSAAARGWSHEGELPEGERIGRNLLASLIGAPLAQVSVALAGRRIVGSSLVTKRDEGWCEIGLLSVAPDLQGQQLGDRLLREAELCAATNFAASRITLEVLDYKARLISYYERRGYARTGLSRPYPHHLSKPARFLLLEKWLTPT